MDKGNKDKLNALHKLLDKELSFLQGHSSTELESRDNSYLSVQRLDESGYGSSNFRATQPEDRFVVSRNEMNQRDSTIGKERVINGFSSSKGNYFTASSYNNNSFQSQQQYINNNSNSQSLHSSFKGNSGPSQTLEEKPYQNTSRFSSGKPFLSPEQGISHQALTNSQLQEKYNVPSKEFIPYDQTKLEDQNPLSNENIQREINGIQHKIQFLEQKIKNHEGKQDPAAKQDHLQDTIFDNALDTFSALPSGQKTTPAHQSQNEKIDSTLYPEDLRGYSSMKARSFNGAISATEKTLKQQDFQGSLALQETMEKRKNLHKNEQQLKEISRSREKNENTDKSIKEKKKLDSSVNYLERDIKTAEHNLDLSKRSLKSSLKTTTGSKVANVSHRWQSQTPPGSSGKKRASSQRGIRERSNSQNHQYSTAPKPFIPIDSYANEYSENVELRQKIFSLKKSHEIEKQKLQEERERNKEIMEEIERMEIKIKKIQIQVEKTAQGEEDYQKLLETSQKSEAIRKQQKTLIEQLREDVEEYKVNQEINCKQKNQKRQQANSSQRNQRK